ncbi:hypothetical protein LCGC14_0772280 [marine sediment metagenome]|uniref:Uncharacterized protein n=1 Tax=marine sediment metagenome TaxID=412755 RepID=A0A0F9Q219_9ZZZZ
MATATLPEAVEASTLFRLSNSETVPLDLAIARKHRDMPGSPTERELTPKRLKHLIDKIKQGLFVCPCWAVVRYKSIDYRMNGQHSSTALCDAHEFFPEGLSVHVDTYEADTEAGVAQLFRQFDDRVSGRSGLDISGAYQGLFDAIRHVPRKEAWQAAKGISWFVRTIEKMSIVTGDDVGELFMVRLYDGFIEWLSGVMTIKTPEMRSDPVIGAMYGTFLASEERARSFWSAVARGGEEDGTAPSQLSIQLVAAKGQKNPDKKLVPMQLYGICVRAWNCYVDGDTPKAAFTQQKKKPLPEIAS